MRFQHLSFGLLALVHLGPAATFVPFSDFTLRLIIPTTCSGTTERARTLRVVTKCLDASLLDLSYLVTW